jgi:Domain of unknown function DUF302
MSTPTTSHTGTHTATHQVNRLIVDTGADLGDFRQRYETLVPDIDFATLTDLIATADLARVAQYTAERTPHSFTNFWTFDPTPTMQLAGNRTRLVTYMMGNNIIAETMLRHDPGVMLYAPLRTAIYQDTTGQTHLSIDQPSTRFACFIDPQIAAVGLALDVKLAALLNLLDVPVPVELQQQR